MTAPIDRRRLLARDDLADVALRGRVSAAAYAEPTFMRVVAPVAPVRRAPRPDRPLDTQALMGEGARVLEVDGEGWAFAQLEADGYVGWLPALSLSATAPVPTHRVVVARTFIYPGPSIKLPTELWLSLGARVAVADLSGDFATLSGGGHVWAAHLAAIDARRADPVQIAEALIGAPYLWGGKTSLGLDCSGLVQLACDACGVGAPRDSDMQEAELGAPLPHDPSGLRRGDLVFWKGHVGWMRDATTLLHANGHHMLVASEPLAEATARIAAKGGGPVTAMRRLG